MPSLQRGRLDADQRLEYGNVLLKGGMMWGPKSVRAAEAVDLNPIALERMIDALREHLGEERSAEPIATLRRMHERATRWRPSGK